MRDMKPAARQRRQGKGRADTCGANPSPGCGNPHPPSLAWSSWEVSVGMGSGWECWQRVLCHTLPLKATGASVGQATAAVFAHNSLSKLQGLQCLSQRLLPAHSNVVSSNAVIMGGIFRHSSWSPF